MTNMLFVLLLGLVYGGILAWGFRVLPRERWQILASVPLEKGEGNTWRGLNITYYGFFSASAYVFSAAMVVILLSSAGLALGAILLISLFIGAACVPAAKIIASLVEGKRHTFTVGGAAFTGVILGPWLVLASNSISHGFISGDLGVMPVLAALSIAYTFGEGAGRLACISFGCRYGKPLSLCPAFFRRHLASFCFVFAGETKKIAYASDFAGEPVVPVQAITSVIYGAAALAGTWLFFGGGYSAAYLLTLGVTQFWRFASEFLRADYRGTGCLSPYQYMALLSPGYGLLMVLLFAPGAQIQEADVRMGLAALWNPTVLIFLQTIWCAIFFLMGRSKVTGSMTSFYVRRDRI